MPCGGETAEDGGDLLLLDSNGDASTNVADAIYLLAYLFQSGPPPVLGTQCVRIPGCPDACGR